MNVYQKIVKRKLDELIPKASKTSKTTKPKIDFSPEKERIVDFVKGIGSQLLVTKETDYTVEILIEQEGYQAHVCVFDFAILGTNRVTESYIAQEIILGLEAVVIDD